MLSWSQKAELTLRVTCASGYSRTSSQCTPLPRPSAARHAPSSASTPFLEEKGKKDDLQFFCGSLPPNFRQLSVARLPWATMAVRETFAVGLVAGESVDLGGLGGLVGGGAPPGFSVLAREVVAGSEFIQRLLLVI